MICIFARSITDELASLVKRIERVVEKNAAQKMAAFVVLLSDDSQRTQQELITLAQRTKINRIPLTVFDGVAGPPEYAIAQDTNVTVLMWDGEKKLVRVNHTFGKGKLSQSFIDKVVADATIRRM